MAKKVPFLSLVSVISCFAVVLLHSNGCFWSFSTESYWKSANLIECLAYFAVPCFFMISGATLLNFREKYSLREYFKKRMVKTLIPFLFWSFVGIVYALLTKTVSFSDLSPLFIYNGVLRNTFVGVYWFFLSLFGMYLCIPLFAAVAEDARRQTFLYLIGAGTVVNIAVPFMIRLSGKDIAWPINIAVAAGPLIYLPLGYMIREYEIPKALRLTLYVLGAAGFSAHLFGTYYLSVKKGAIDDLFKGYTNLPCLLFSVAVFVFFKYHSEKILRFQPVRRLIGFLSGYTFPVYLMHWFMLNGACRLLAIDTHALWYRLGAPFLVIPAVVAITWVLKKIPVVKRIVP